MIINKTFSLPKAYRILENFIKNNENSLDDRITIYRLLNKLSDTVDFESRVNKEFSAYKLKYKKQAIDDALDARQDIDLFCGFTLHPSRTTNWQLYFNDELFLDTLDYKCARRIAFDINVAFSIKAAQIAKGK